MLNSFILFFRLIIRAKLLGEECNFFCVSWLLSEGYFWEHVFLTSHVSAKTNVSFVVIRQSFSSLYLNSNETSCPILRFQEMDLPKTPLLMPHIHYLHAVCTGYVRTVINVILLAKHLAISLLTVEGFTWIFVCWSKGVFRILPKRESWDWCMIMFIFHYLSITCLVSLYITFRNSSHFSKIDAHRLL